MEWETPSFTEIDMSAEIGAYQGDDSPGHGDFVPRRPEPAEPPYSEPEQG
jgi:coenzyme PQQ precursor peptide PqqA